MSTIEELNNQYQRLLAERNCEVTTIFGLTDQVDFVDDCLDSDRDSSLKSIQVKRCQQINKQNHQDAAVAHSVIKYLSDLDAQSHCSQSQ